MIHPIREGRRPHHLGTKGKSNWRGSVGRNLCRGLKRQGQVVAWASQPAKPAEQAFPPWVTAVEGQSLGLAERGLQAAQGAPAGIVSSFSEPVFLFVIEAFAIFPSLRHRW